MPDYIYLLENRLSPGQQNALKVIRESARDAQMNVFLTGGAVRDLTSGSPVRDLDVSVQGNALKLKKTLEKAGGVLVGEDDPSHTLFFHFGGGARAEVSSTRRVEYPKPGKPVYHFASIHEDLRRRDFTANAMALSLNEGSYGLLMDPLNGVADIESRLLRLVSNYGFLERPALLIRATRFAARLGWELEEKTKVRFENAKIEGIIDHLSDWHRGYELEEIGHEEDSLRILKVMEEAGWMKNLFPAWTSAKADVAGLDQLREVLNQLQMQGVNPDTSSASLTLMTAKMSTKELNELKKLFVRQGFVQEWNSLDARAKEFAKVLTSKQVATPSATWKLLTSSNPEAVLWLGFTGKAAAVQEKFHNFFSVWPEARQKIPYALMQEMRIVPELPGYQELLHNLFFELIDGKLETEEQIRAFLEPFSPPAPPPPVNIRRTRGKKTAEAKAKAKAEEAEEAEEEELEELPEGMSLKLDDEEVEEEEEDEDLDEDAGPAPAKKGKGKAEPKVEAKPVKPVAPAKAEKPVAKPAEKPVAKAAEKAAAKPVEKPAAKVAEKKGPEPKSAHKPVPVPAKTSAKGATAKPAVPVKATVPVKAAAKAAEKKAAPPAKKAAPPSKAVAKKVAPKAVVHAKAAKPLKKPAAKPAAKHNGAKPTHKVAKPAAKPAAKAKPVVKGKPAAKHAPSKPVKKKR
jgi:tRNA nucleotidyltransferase (CCA-adding enzyme)